VLLPACAGLCYTRTRAVQEAQAFLRDRRLIVVRGGTAPWLLDTGLASA
jgi:hypothetical protein